jgi:tRNA U34 5-methylaminomethyl-2-thiouridine-forming methyltransferase MnmC
MITIWGINIDFCSMQRTLILTKDGSHTVAVPDMDVTYHSMHGAIQESMHVFIEAGWLESIKQQETGRIISILEMGLGTGLNALLTLIEAEKISQPVHYTALELYPLEKQEIDSLNYCEQLDRKDLTFELLHQCEWGREVHITSHFTLKKIQADLVNFSTPQSFNLVYFDAFAPTAQPELWTKEVFEKIYNMMQPGGILVTYCSKGDVRRAMQAAGLSIEKIPGPPGKREMVRAKKA